MTKIKTFKEICDKKSGFITFEEQLSGVNIVKDAPIIREYDKLIRNEVRNWVNEMKHKAEEMKDTPEAYLLWAPWFVEFVFDLTKENLNTEITKEMLDKLKRVFPSKKDETTNRYFERIIEER
jgi:hypothetical protein